jgi:hypothetical protein
LTTASQQQPKRLKNSSDAKTTATYYLTNSQLLPEVVASKAACKMSPKLAGMLMLLTRRIASRPSFSGYTFKEDMIAEALADLCKNALKFNPERSDNPFAFYTSCIHNSFLGFLNVEKKHRRIRDQLLVDIGENPSFNFQDEYKEQLKEGGMREEFEQLSADISEARERKTREDAQIAAEKAAEKAEAAAAAALLIYEDAPAVIAALSETISDGHLSESNTEGDVDGRSSLDANEADLGDHAKPPVQQDQ